MKIQYFMASAMLALFGFGSNLYAEASDDTVKLHVSVLDEDLNYVDGVKKDLVVEDVRGTQHSYNKADLKKEYTFQKGTSATFYVVKPSTSKVGYKKSSDYNKVYLTRATTERDIVLLSKGTKKVSNATALIAPVVAYTSKTTVEVNMQPFAGVDFKNRKDLSVKYQVVAKKIGTKISITKYSSSPKVQFVLSKGAWSFKYYVRFVDKNGKNIAGTKHYSPATKAYIGYEYDTVSDASVLARPEVHIKKEYEDKKSCSINGCGYTTRVVKYTVIAVAPSFEKAIYDNKVADISYHIDLYKTNAGGADYTDDTEGEKVGECDSRSCIISADPYSAYKAVYKLELNIGSKSVYTNKGVSLWEQTGPRCISGYRCPAIDLTVREAHVANISQQNDIEGTLKINLGGFEQNLYPDYLIRNVKTNAYTLFTEVYGKYRGGLSFSKINNQVVVTYLQKDETGDEKEIQEPFEKGDYEVQARYGSNYSWGGVAEFAIE